MTHEEKVFELLKAIAPVMVAKGLEIQERIIASGGDPTNCKVGGMSIPEAYAESAKQWAEAFAKA